MKKLAKIVVVGTLVIGAVVTGVGAVRPATWFSDEPKREVIEPQFVEGKEPVLEEELAKVIVKVAMIWLEARQDDVAENGGE